MIIAVIHHDLDVGHRIAREHAVLERFYRALLHRRNKFFRDRSAANLVNELVLTAGQRLHAQFDAGVLTATASLLLMRVVRFGDVANRFSIGHLRLTDIGAHIKLALHAVDDDFQM